jgi:Flp pilus assembly protein TadD
MIREVAERDSTNTFAQLTLGEASVMSGQLDKAVERFKTVVRLQPDNLQGILLLADTYDRMANKDEAAKMYERSLPLVANPEIRREIQKRVTDLRNKK